MLLNDKQMEACSFTEGPLLILAGAGSGKTRVITQRIAYLIEEMGVNPYNILAITFTNKAANEMRERVLSQVEDYGESVWISTFHSMCVRILRRFHDRLGGQNNFTIYDTDDQKAVIKEVLKSLSFDSKQYPEKGCIAYISKEKEEFRTPDESESYAVDFREQNLVKIYREYQKRMAQNNALDFDDLIFKTLQLFIREEDVLEMYQARFKYIMVDEYQDTNHSQFLLVKYLAAMWRNLCVVGDDDQSIYKFRGADITNILNFQKEYPEAKIVKLEQNYRSTTNILDAANSVISNNTERKDKKLWSDNGEGSKIHYTLYDTDREEAHGIINTIQELNIDGWRYSDIAILYRTNAQSRALEEKLIYANVPYRLYGGTGFYSRREIRDLMAYLKLIANPSDEVSFSRIINVPKRGIGATTVTKIRNNAYESGLSMYDFCMDEAHLDELGKVGEKVGGFIKMMQDFRALSEGNELGELFDEIVSKTGYRAELLLENTDEARGRIENIDELKNKIVSFMESSEEPTLEGLLEEISLVADSEEGEDSDDVVTLMTLHSAKGLEFPVVFISGMEERLFPSGMAMDSGDPGAIEEERRLCYVGITRAKKELFLSGATTRMLNGMWTYPAESRFLKEIPDNLIERSGIKAKRVTRSDISKNEYKTKPYSGIRTPHVPYATAKTQPVSASSIDYAVGDTVKHIKFGKGVVKEMIKMGDEYEITVDFDSAGEKKMFATLAKLKKV